MVGAVRAAQRRLRALVGLLLIVAAVFPLSSPASEPTVSEAQVPDASDVLTLLTAEELSAARATRQDRSQRTKTLQIPEVKTDPEGPLVSLTRPDLKPATRVLSPFELQVSWQPRTGVEVDVDSLQVFYVENGATIEGTSKVRQCQKLIARAMCRLDKHGLWVKKAEFPPGSYKVVMFVADTRKRFSRADFDVTVSAPGS